MAKRKVTAVDVPVKPFHRRIVMGTMGKALGFGVIMVMGTHFALTGTYSWVAFTASLVPSFLVSNLLLLNQFPDVDADQSTGRRHFPITIGRRASAHLYGILLLLTYASIIVGVLLEILPPLALLALLTVALSLKAYRSSRKNAKNIPALVPAMGINVIINLITPALLAVGLFIS